MNSSVYPISGYKNCAYWIPGFMILAYRNCVLLGTWKPDSWLQELWLLIPGYRIQVPLSTGYLTVDHRNGNYWILSF
jgi:hypothetical protein